MDRGPLEREEAEKIKVVIAKSGHKRKTSRLDDVQSTARLDNRVGDSFPKVCRESANLTESQMSVGMSNEIETASIHVATASEILMEQPLGMDFQSQDALITNEIWQHQNLVAGDGPLDIGAEFQSPFEFIMDYGPSTDHLSLGSDQFSTEDWTLTTVVAQNNEISLSTDGSIIARDTNDSTSSLEGEQSRITEIPGTLSVDRAVLLSYYLDKVVYEQFLFSTDSVSGGRQWLQFLLLSSNPVLEISLILSGAHFSSGTNPNYLGDSNNYQNDLNRAVGVLKRLPSTTATLSLLNKERRLSQTLTACACFVQTIYLEVCGPPLSFSTFFFL